MGVAYRLLITIHFCSSLHKALNYGGALNFPPPSPDDTQPHNLISPPTGKPVARRSIFVALMIVTSFTLMATIVWWQMQAQPQPIALANITPIPIALMIDGQRTDALTTARTVAQFLQEQQITLEPQDALSVPPEATLEADQLITIAKARDVLLRVDGNAQTIRTPYTLPYDILKQQNVMLSDHDRVWLDDLEVEIVEVLLWSLPVTRIQVEYAVTVTLVDENTSTELITTADTVGDALFEAAITLYLADEVQPDVAAPIVDGMTISITRAQPLQIVVDGQTLETRAQAGNVRDALAETGVALIGLDYSIPSETDPVSPGMTITIVRVTEELVGEDVPIEFATQYVPDETLSLDSRVVRQEGVNGLLRRNQRVRYENDVEVSRDDAGEEVMQASTPRIMAYGTQIVLNSISTPEGTFEYWRRLRVYATSYHPAALGGDNVTSIGETLRKGIIGADPKLIPYRTNIYVEGYGTGFIADTGGARSSPYWIDLGYSDEDFVGWHRYVDIYLLTPVPADINYLLPEWRELRGVSDGGG